MPTPDGTRRLIRVVFEKDATQLPVVAELGYREDGSFAGAVTSFDAFGDYDDWQFDAEIEKDDLGRLILDRDANRWGNQTYTYRYAEDGQSYTLGRDWGTGSREQEIRLADLQIPELVKKPLGAFANGETREFNDEGLLTRCGINKRKEADGTITEIVQDYSYHWETGVVARYTSAYPATEGATVLKQTYTTDYGSHDRNYLVFDDHGYLAAYYPPGASNPSFHYYYE